VDKSRFGIHRHQQQHDLSAILGRGQLEQPVFPVAGDSVTVAVLDVVRARAVSRLVLAGGRRTGATGNVTGLELAEVEFVASDAEVFDDVRDDAAWHIAVKGSVREIVMFSAGLFSPAADGSQGHMSSHAERLRDLPPSRECNVTRYSVGGVAVQVRAHSPCSGRLVSGIR
jgi:hypothetical protein